MWLTGANAAVLRQQLPIGVDAVHYLDTSTAVLSSPPVSPLWLPDGSNLLLQDQRVDVSTKQPIPRHRMSLTQKCNAQHGLMRLWQQQQQRQQGQQACMRTGSNCRCQRP
jgi:hypothetical protein